MKLSAAQRKRLEELAREMQEIVGGCVAEDGRPLTFDELEEECIEAGDYVTAQLLQERVARRAIPVEARCCPTCERAGQPATDEPRVLQTDRGEVTWMEPTFYCRHCRRAFFPSVE